MLSIILSLVLGIVHYFSEKIYSLISAQRIKIISFAAGISITYLFLVLFPELYYAVEHLQKLLFIYLLLGFASFHLIEKFIYKYARKRDLKRELKEAHSIAFFIYYFLIGIILVNFVKINILAGVLFFIPIFFHTAFTPVSLSGIHQKVRENRLAKLILSGSAFFGVILAKNILIPQKIYHALLGFVVGILLYVIVRELIPRKKKGEPLFFVLGIILYLILIVLTWFVRI